MGVEPIRDKEKIEQMRKILKRSSYRDYAIFHVGLNTGLRISDILELKVADVKNKTHITLKDRKTRHVKSKAYRKIKINLGMQEFFADYIEGMHDDDYLFTSRKGTNQPITRQHAWRVIKEAAAKVGIEDIGTHTMRKSFGYHYYQKTKDVALLQGIFNHSAPSITLRYIGINQDKLDEAMDNFSL